MLLSDPGAFALEGDEHFGDVADVAAHGFER